MSQEDVAEVDFMGLLVVGPQAEKLTLKGFADKAAVLEPLNISLGVDHSHLKISAVFQRPNRTIFDFRWYIDFGRISHAKGLMGPDLIKPLYPFSAPPLLGLQVCGWRFGYLDFQSQMHPFMSRILVGLSRIDKVHLNAQ